MAGSAKTVEDSLPQLASGTRFGLLRDVLEAVILGLLTASAVFLLQWRYGFNWGDEGWLWYISQRTALGQVPVRDVFSYDPGRYYWSAAVFKLLGRDGFYEQLAANYLFGAVGLAISYLALARTGVSRGWRIALLVLLGIALGFPRHKIYEQTISLIAVAGITFIVSRPEKLRRWFSYGIAAGVAAFVGKNSGVYVALAALLAFLLLKISRASTPYRPLAALFAGVAIGYLPMIFMVIHYAGFGSVFLQSVLLAPHWAWALPVPFPWHSHANALHGLDALQVRAVSWLCLAVPLSYLLIILNGARTRLRGTQALATGASLAGVPCLYQAFYHADFFHIAQGFVPFVVALGAFSQHLSATGRRRWGTVCFSGLTVLVLGCWLPVEPLIQHLRTKARAPQSVEQITMDGRDFEVPAGQASVMRRVDVAFRNCGAHDGGFLEAPFYPGLYAFLKTRAPFWETYYFWPRDEALQDKHIQALIENRTSLVLMNPEASFDGQDWLRIGRTYPKLVSFIQTHYERVQAPLPQGFELYWLPQACRVAPSPD
jgi:hypothetical protein